MPRALLLASLTLALFALARTGAAGEDYPLGPDSQEQAGVAKGTVKDFTWKESKVFPGTERKYWIYLPPGFDANQEYPLIVFSDGGGVVGATGGFRAPLVLDNLIAKKDIPAMVGLFINPGNVPPVTPGGENRSTRSFEYDTADDAYARFLIEEMLPEVAKLAKISAKPEDRALAGISSGGICAFAAAWFHPEAFRKVITGIGSFTTIQGGFWFPAAIRKTERKPLRIYLQEGENDLDNVHGNWPLANKEMVAALKFAGYDLKAEFGTGGHSGKQLGAALPDALRWLWRKDEPAPAPVPEVKGDLALSGLLIPGENWQAVVEDKKSVDAACTDADGNFYFSDLGGGGGIFRIAASDGAVTSFNKDATGISGMKFGADGRLYACHNKEKRIIAIDKDGKVEVLATDIGCNDLAVDAKGHIYITETGKKQVVLIDAGKVKPIETGIKAPNGIAISPDQETLAVSDYSGAAAWAFRVEADGGLSGGMPVMPYRAFGRVVEGKGDGMTCDTRGRWYCSSQTGIQVFDPNGRPVGLVLAPTSAAITSVALSGPGLNWLFALTQGKVFKRKVDATGFVAALPPIYKQPAKK